jgi:superoxide dismutase, Fe-Mn family
MSDLDQLQLATLGTDPPDAPRYPFEPPPPPFPVEALEPWIGAATVRLQREVHLRYARRLNALLERIPHLQHLSVETLVRRSAELPELERADLRDAAIGHANHQFWWKMLKAGGNGGAGPTGRLAERVERDFGSLDGLKSRFAALATGHVGSGWAFLAVDPLNGGLALAALPNNGSIMDLKMPGIMICDLWEHAYTLDRGADRAAYLEAWWNVVDWEALGRRLDGFYAGATHT